LTLAEAMPAEKYSWRPAEGMRSVGGLFAHVVTDNYRAVAALDQELPAPPGGLHLHSTFQPETILALSEDKPKLLEELKSSFAQLRARVLKLSDADGDEPRTMMNRETTLRGALLIVDRHLGEHLGQAIVYARINGLVPPGSKSCSSKSLPINRSREPAECPGCGRREDHFPLQRASLLCRTRY